MQIKVLITPTIAGLQIKSSVTELKDYFKRKKVEKHPPKTFKQFLKECLEDKEITNGEKA
ncbi:MAG: hypothetical protein AB1397_01760 [bacterium]